MVFFCSQLDERCCPEIHGTRIITQKKKFRKEGGGVWIAGSHYGSCSETILQRERTKKKKTSLPLVQACNLLTIKKEKKREIILFSYSYQCCNFFLLYIYIYTFIRSRIFIYFFPPPLFLRVVGQWKIFFFLSAAVFLLQRAKREN